MHCDDGQIKHEAKAAVGVLLLAVILTTMTTLSFVRNRIYESDINMWADVVRKTPSKQRPHYNYGYALGKGGAHREALAAYEKALSLPYDGRVRLEKILNDMGTSYFELGLYDQAVSTWSRWLAVVPRSAKFLNNIAVARLEQGRYDDASSYARQAIDADPFLADAYNTMAEVLFAKQRYRQAADFFLAAIVREPNGALRYWNAALAFERAGEYEKALRFASQFLSMEADPRYRQAAMQLVNSLNSRMSGGKK